MRTAGLALVLLLSGCGHAPVRRQAQAGVEPEGARPESVAVEAEGWAPVDAADSLGTVKRALAEAQKKAVEKVTGVSVRARTVVAQSISVEQRIWAAARGRILSYDILDEREEGGFHKTRIRAVVLKGDMKSDPWPGQPTVAVVVDTRSFPDRGAAERGLRQALLDAGVSLAFGKTDFLVSGEAAVSALDASGLEGFASCRARLSVELREPASDRLLASKSFEASAIGVSRSLAAAKALEQAGRLAGERLAADLRAEISQR